MVDPLSQPSTTTILVVFQQRAVANWVGDSLRIGDCLREVGYSVVVAKGYDDALPALCLIGPDAVVLSASKLDRHAEAFLDSLERDPHARGIPTIVLSQTKSQAGLAHIAARRNPRIGYLSGPFKCRDLRLIMQDLLQGDTQPVRTTPSRCVVLDPRLPVLRGRSGVIIVTPGEYRLADYLISHRGQPVALREVLARLFSFSSSDGSPALVRAHVASLRQKIRIVAGGRDLIRPAGKGGIVYLGSGRAARREPRFS